MDSKYARLVAEGYDRVAEAYARLDEGDWPRGRWLAQLLALTPKGTDVLDLGCASGVPVAREIAREHTVTGIACRRGRLRRHGGTCSGEPSRSAT